MAIKITPDVLLRLATNYELLSLATSEADSTMVTLYVRPAANNLLESSRFTDSLMKTVQNAINKASGAGQNVSGSLKNIDMVLNASQVGGRWQLDAARSGLRVSGSLMSNPTVAGAVNNLLRGMNAKLLASINGVLNKASGNLQGTKITNHETDLMDLDLSV